MDFHEKLQTAWLVSNSRLCVGLDPFIEKIPARFLNQPRPVLAFNRWIIVHIASAILMYVLLVLHIWSEIYYGLRWLA